MYNGSIKNVTQIRCHKFGCPHDDELINTFYDYFLLLFFSERAIKKLDEIGFCKISSVIMKDNKEYHDQTSRNFKKYDSYIQIRIIQ